MLVKDAMDKTVAVCVPFDSAKNAATIMRRNDIAFIPVIENEPTHVYMGAVTDRSLCLRVIGNGLDPDKTQLSECLGYQTAFCRPEDPIERAVQTMRRKRLKALAVLNADREVVGVVSLDDLLKKASSVAAKMGGESANRARKQPRSAGYSSAHRAPESQLTKTHPRF